MKEVKKLDIDTLKDIRKHATNPKLQKDLDDKIKVLSENKIVEK